MQSLPMPEKPPTAQEQPANDAPTWRISSPPQEDDDDITLSIRVLATLVINSENALFRGKNVVHFLAR